MQLYEWKRKYHSDTIMKDECLYLKDLIIHSGSVYKDIPTKLLWDSFIDCKFDFQKAMVMLRRRIASLEDGREFY